MKVNNTTKDNTTKEYVLKIKTSKINQKIEKLLINNIYETTLRKYLEKQIYKIGNDIINKHLVDAIYVYVSEISRIELDNMHKNLEKLKHHTKYKGKYDPLKICYCVKCIKNTDNQCENISDALNCPYRWF